MPTLDVSEAILSPEFLTSFLVTTYSRTIGSNGVAVDTPSGPTTAYGVVTPNADSFTRLDDGSRLSTTLDIITRFPLSDGNTTDDVHSRNADIVTWRGRQYTICSVLDWSQFGRGFIKAAADLQEINPGAPS